MEILYCELGETCKTTIDISTFSVPFFELFTNLKSKDSKKREHARSFAPANISYLVTHFFIAYSFY